MVRIPLSILFLLALATPVLAHPGHDPAAGLLHGFAHPFTGLDHLLAMTAAGLYAARQGGRALWLVPLSFVAMMAAGGAMAMAGIGLPFVETGIGVSVVALGAGVALRWTMPTVAAMAVAGLFALFHGHAHGSEMALTANGLDYAAGFLLATTTLHAIGIAAGHAAVRLAPRHSHSLLRFAGTSIALAGAAILSGAT